MFHLMTHAFFKALLFLAAGSVIIGMHHDQDIRNMGGLKKYMPITWITSLVGSLALIGTPLFAGFYSKDLIIEAVHASHLPGAGFAYLAVLAGVFVTAFYSFRMYFLVFHGPERFRDKPFPMPAHDDHATHEALAGEGGGAQATHDEPDPHAHDAHAPTPHESPAVVTLPLIALAIPSAMIGFVTIGPLFGGFFNDSITVLAERHPAMEELAREFHGPIAMAVHAFTGPVFWLALAGVVLSWFFYLRRPDIPAAIQRRFSFLYRLLDNKYYLDWFNENVLTRGARLLGTGLWRGGDVGIIDNILIDGTAKTLGGVAILSRRLQSGYLYWYALVMIIGVIGLMTWHLWPFLANLLAR
jgi:NADH-quinone oxidoreductase subunit L